MQKKRNEEEEHCVICGREIEYHLPHLEHRVKLTATSGVICRQCAQWLEDKITEKIFMMH